MKKATVVVTPDFRDGADAILDAIAVVAPARAAKLEAEIESKAASLDQNARRGRMVPEFEDDPFARAAHLQE